MKANELRIGNLVLSQWENNKIHKVRGQDIFDLEQGIDSNSFQPIPLTEEWLLKFGFNKGKFNYKWQYGNFIYDQKLKLWVWFGVQIHDYLIENVHQLQNLYFALTAQELTIK